jgi:hypothetical protein
MATLLVSMAISAVVVVALMEARSIVFWAAVVLMEAMVICQIDLEVYNLVGQCRRDEEYRAGNPQIRGGRVGMGLERNPFELFGGGRYSAPKFRELSGSSNLCDTKDLQNTFAPLFGWRPNAFGCCACERLGSLFAVFVRERTHSACFWAVALIDC